MAKQRTKMKRHERQRRESPYLVVVCEGETEERYFGWLKKKYRLNQMEVLKPDETNPKAILMYALRRRKSLVADGVAAEVWIVFDAESDQDERENKYRDVIVQAEARGIRLANSSPCFEFWVLLHYTEFINVATPKEAKRELARDDKISGYSTPNLPYEELWAFTQTGTPAYRANRRRNDLEKQGEDPRFARPVTFVDLLVEAIVNLSQWKTKPDE